MGGLGMTAVLWCMALVTATTATPSGNGDTGAWDEMRAAMVVTQAILQHQTRILNQLLNTTQDIRTSCSQAWWCPPPYKQVLAECFYLSTHDLPWLEARTHCQAFGGDLATPAALIRLFSFIRDSGINEHERVWVGGTDRRGAWRWLNGRSIPQSDWAEGQPNNWDGDQHCLTLLLGTRPTLNDANCDLNYRFVCQHIRSF